jgi:hypothetical protein
MSGGISLLEFLTFVASKISYAHGMAGVWKCAKTHFLAHMNWSLRSLASLSSCQHVQ